MIFVFCVYLLVIGFVPYLAKESKYRRHLSVKDHFRDISDKLIVTSLVYLAASVYGLVKGQYEVSFLCAVTWWSSSSYHFFRESMYFNVDNIFAASLFIAFIYSLWISSGRADLEWYTNIGTIGLVLAGFLLIYCGNPATISFDNSYSPACCIRSGRALYDNVHSIWHLISGIGPTLSIWLFDYALEKELSAYLGLQSSDEQESMAYRGRFFIRYSKRNFQVTSEDTDLQLLLNVINEKEESILVGYLSSLLSRKKYQGNHWDDVISEYKEIELQRKSATPDVLAIIDNIQNVIAKSQEHAATKFRAEFMQPHVIDLAGNGHIAPHVDSIKFSGDMIAGISLLSTRTMVLSPEGDPASSRDPVADIALRLPPRSLYVVQR
eukprot:gene28314-37245_t